MERFFCCAPVTGAHKNRLRADHHAEIEVIEFVADDNRPVQVDAQRAGGLFGHTGVRFAATASHGVLWNRAERIVRASGGSIESDRICGEQLLEPMLDGVHGGDWKDTARDSGLVRERNKFVAERTGTRERFGSAGNKFDFVRV